MTNPSLWLPSRNQKSDNINLYQNTRPRTLLSRKSKYAIIDVAIQSAVVKFHYDRPLVWRSWSRVQTWHSVADSWHLALRGEAAAESESKGQNWQKTEAVDQEAR